jgi:hypothetical protein
MSNESQDRVQEQAREAIRGSQGQHRGRQFALWMGALIIGAILTFSQRMISAIRSEVVFSDTMHGTP